MYRNQTYLAPMSYIPFTKMHGLGNDFVVLDNRKGNLEIEPADVCAIGDRRTGVGFDQLLILEQARNPTAHIFMQILNPDGSEAEACGNGTRCVAALIMTEMGKSNASIETIAGILETKCTSKNMVSVDMGRAQWDWQHIPLSEERDTLNLGISSGNLVDPAAVNIGNPHMVFFVDDAESIDLSAHGPKLENHPLFPERTNVEVASLIGPDKIRMRVWERGAGITPACGSGACAVGVTAHLRGLTSRKIEVFLDGGRLTIEWTERDRIIMTGPVATAFEGTLDLNGITKAH